MRSAWPGRARQPGRQPVINVSRNSRIRAPDTREALPVVDHGQATIDLVDAVALVGQHRRQAVVTASGCHGLGRPRWTQLLRDHGSARAGPVATSNVLCSSRCVASRRTAALVHFSRGQMNAWACSVPRSRRSRHGWAAEQRAGPASGMWGPVHGVGSGAGSGGAGSAGARRPTPRRARLRCLTQGRPRNTRVSPKRSWSYPPCVQFVPSKSKGMP